LPQQVLEAHKPELLILRVRHFRDSIRQHQKINRVGSS
jgi:hypothetical protein